MSNDFFLVFQNFFRVNLNLGSNELSSSMQEEESFTCVGLWLYIGAQQVKFKLDNLYQFLLY